MACGASAWSEPRAEEHASGPSEPAARAALKRRGARACEWRGGAVAVALAAQRRRSGRWAAGAAGAAGVAHERGRLVLVALLVVLLVALPVAVLVVALLVVARQPAERLGLCKAKAKRGGKQVRKHESEGGKQPVVEPLDEVIERIANGLVVVA